ncbi:hypothetical protein NLG97_g2930 [Lecanicillium saksenae]|uniref:Uncharacterized protein n=1 Tax=Lecanicillium saksenae TaxID=468837 RepID=A0ACC1R3K2_9HYPO|nr:hypothetical protein NLG97_g2930 [Lecanicillium saksenae]
MSFSATTIQGLKDIIGAAVKADDGGVPGITAVVFDRSGTELFVHSVGKCGASSTKPLTPGHVFWMASCTKIVTAMSVMQLVERGSLSLDDGAELEALCPELKEVQVLRDDGTLEPKKSSLTLRMLLTHTSGFGYTFYNEKLREYGSPIGVDWAGIAVERRTGVSLNEYMQTHIFKPLGLKNISMIPTSEMKANLAHMNYRDPSGKVIPRDHPYRQPLVVETAEEKAKLFNSGGGGLFAKPQEYCPLC